MSKNVHWSLLLLSLLSGCASVSQGPQEVPVAVALCPALPPLPASPESLHLPYVSRMERFLAGQLEQGSTERTPSGYLKKPGEPTNYALPTTGTEPRMKMPRQN